MAILLKKYSGWLLVGGLLWAAAPIANGRDRYEKLDVFLEQLHQSKTDPVTRLHQISKLFLGVPYGRESEVAESTRAEKESFRFDALDCTTFLEQALALAHSRNLAQAEENLIKIRYIGGIIDYAQRKHFMMAQWIPMNQKEGFIEDITCKIGKDTVRWVSKRLDAEVWRMRTRKDRLPRLEPGQIPVGTFRLPIIPRDAMLAKIRAIPAGIILNVVRADYRSIPYRISHQGLVVQLKGKKYLRHAARAGYARVVDEPLEVFLGRNLAYTRWPVAGINLQAICVSKESAVASKDKPH